MPQFLFALGALVTSVVGPGAIASGFASLAIASTGAFGSLLTLGLSLGISYLSSVLFKPKSPRPEDVQTSARNPTATRVRHYGRVKVSGPWVFGESKAGSFHKVAALGTGELDAIEEFWIDDTLVNLDEDGGVTTAPWATSGLSKIYIQYRLGYESSPHYATLGEAFPEWDDSHKLNGVSTLYTLMRPVTLERFSELYPNSINTNFRVVARASKLYNPATATTAWSDNAALVIRDYMIHPDGMRLPSAVVTSPQATAKWISAVSKAAMAVPLKAGGTEPQFRLWGSYFFDERPADVIGRMLGSCDGRLVPTPDGGVALDMGYTSPTVILTNDPMTGAIVGFSELSRGRDVTQTANLIRGVYTSPLHDYQTTDAEQWADEEDIASRGEYAKEVGFIMSPSHGQTRRLMKLESYRSNPNWIGVFQCKLSAMAAFTHRFIQIKYDFTDTFGFDEVFEVLDFKFNIDGGILSSITISVQSMPAEAYSWNAATEEGDIPISEATEVDKTIPVPSSLSFGVDRILVGSTLVPFGVLQFPESPTGLTVQARYKLVSAEEWISVGVSPEATEAQTGALSDGSQYEAQIRHLSISTRGSAWTTSQFVTPIADPTPPGVVTNVSATGGAGAATVNWDAPNSANYVAVNVRRNTTNDEPAGAPIYTEYGPPSTADSWSDTGIAPGTYYYWLRSRNSSGVESAGVSTGSITVT